MKYFLGVDIGGTKTHALIADESGNALGFGASGPGNHQGVGYDGLRDAVIESAGMALKTASLNIEQVNAAGFGIGGYDWPSQLQDHLNAITPLGLTCPIEIANDSIVGLLAGASQGWGIVLIAGTGNNCRGRDKTGREARITGEGMRFGEFGGGGELVMKAIHAVAYEWTRRGPATLLSKMFMDITGAKDLDDLIEGIDTSRYVADAAWALAIFQSAYSGDPVAREVVQWSARELGESACGVIRQLNFQEEEFEAIMAGSIFSGGDLYTQPLQETILSLAPKAKFVELEAPPVVGGVVLAMQKAGLDTKPIHKNIIESTRQFIQEVEL
ncbi:MAG: ATPase [Chloroflexi bacterium]|nr:ATPase [Chloroflexota bacterium]